MGRSLEAQIRRLRDLYGSDTDPDRRGFVSLANALRKAEEYPESRKILDEGLTRFPDSTSGHVVAAWLQQDQGDLEEAEASFRAVLQVDSRNLSALRGIGSLLDEKGDAEGALGFYQDLLKENPADGDLQARVQDLKDRLSVEGVDVEGEDSGEYPSAEEGREEPDEREEDVFGLNWEHARLQEDRPYQRSVLDEEESEDQGDDHQVWLAEEGIPIPEVRDREDTLVTPTLGEIYLRQGLLGRAEEVFEALLARDPENEILASRLAAVQAIQRGEEPDPGPEQSEEEGDRGVVPLESLSPAESEVFPVEALGPADPDVVPIESLAPEDQGVVSIESLAPEGQGVVTVESLAPEDSLVTPEVEFVRGDVVSIQSLAPSDLDVVSVEALAPDPPGEQTPGGEEGSRGNDPTLNAFQAWLDSL